MPQLSAALLVLALASGVASGSYRVTVHSTYVPMDCTGDEEDLSKTEEGRFIRKLQETFEDPTLDAILEGRIGLGVWKFQLADSTTFNRDAFRRAFKEQGASVSRIEIAGIAGKASKDKKAGWRFKAIDSKSEFRLAAGPKGKDGANPMAELEKLAEDGEALLEIRGDIDLKSKETVLQLAEVKALPVEKPATE